MRTTPSKMTVEDFLRSRVKDREALRSASARLDAFRKKYGQPEPGFDATRILRKLREAR